jgi:hypothetical protein
MCFDQAVLAYVRKATNLGPAVELVVPVQSRILRRLQRFSKNDLVLLPDARLALEPNFYCLDIACLFAFIQARVDSFFCNSQ